MRSAVSAGRRFRDEACMLSKDLQHGGRFVGRPKFSERLYGYDKPIGEHTIANGRGDALDDSRQMNIEGWRGTLSRQYAGSIVMQTQTCLGRRPGPPIPAEHDAL